MVKKVSSKSSKVFAYNLNNLKQSCKMRGEHRRIFLGDLEFMRTHKFKSMPRKDNKTFGKWVERKVPIKKIKGFACRRQ